MAFFALIIVALLQIYKTVETTFGISNMGDDFGYYFFYAGSILFIAMINPQKPSYF
jgi:hypothetical protein